MCISTLHGAKNSVGTPGEMTEATDRPTDRDLRSISVIFATFHQRTRVGDIYKYPSIIATAYYLCTDDAQSKQRKHSTPRTDHRFLLQFT